MALRRWPWRVATLSVWLATAAAAHAEPTDSASLAGSYLDRDGELRDPADVYDARLDALEPNHLRLLIEEAGVLGIGAVWYWLDRDRNLADWDFPSWEQRFSGEAWRLDNNQFPINFIAHPLNGAAFYLLPRLNDNGVAVSSAYALATSFAWEFLLEFREKVSVNDLLVTEGAGIPIGEFANKLFRYFNGIPPTAGTGREALAATAGFPYWIHRVADGDPAHVDGPYDEHGFSTAVGKRLFAGYRVRVHDYGRAPVSTHGFTLGGRLSTIPGEGRPGSFALFFHEADIVHLTLDAGVGRNGRELELATHAKLLGLYAQEIDRSGDGPEGLIGLDLAYRYRFQQLGDYNDRLAILHLPGPGAAFRLRAHPLEVRTHWSLSGDFAGLHAPAYGAWVDAHAEGRQRPKSILRKHGYYYGWGISTRFGAQIALPPLDLSTQGFVGTYDSQEGLDRAQEELTADPDSGDQLLEIGLELGFSVPATPVRFSLGWSSHRRWSHVEEQHTEVDLESLQLGVEGVL